MHIKRPEDVWPLDPEYARGYAERVRIGMETARRLDACVVAIARNAMPMLPNTLALLDELRGAWRSCRAYFYENDSTDGTAECLDDYAAETPLTVVEHDTLGGPDSRGFEPERTVRLARCRNKCLKSPALDGTSVTIVLDLDPQYGFSVDGVFNSLAWLSQKTVEPSVLKAGGMVSYSLYRLKDGRIAHYDAWAARPPCFWRDMRGQIGFSWFWQFLPPVGSHPTPMNSAFGGLGLYWTDAIRSSAYEGGDCEHVALHRGMANAGWQLWLNPGCRYIAVWEE